jgi:hypothetical protein
MTAVVNAESLRERKGDVRWRALPAATIDGLKRFDDVTALLLRN